MHKKTDEQLALQFAKGDDGALQQLISRYLKPLYNFAYQLTQDKGAAEDIVQITFVKLWKNIDSFDESKKFSTWLYAITKNTAFDHLKKKKALPFAAFENADGSNMLEHVKDEATVYSDEFLKILDEKSEVRKMLENLPTLAKTIILMREVQGFSLIEIAEILGESQNTTKSKYRRAILSLREKFSSEKGAINAAP